MSYSPRSSDHICIAAISLVSSLGLEQNMSSVTRFHSITQSGYTLRGAFDELAPGTQAQTATVRWSAFPVTAPASAASMPSRGRSCRRADLLQKNIDALGLQGLLYGFMWSPSIMKA
jgi:hypothetical protein